MPTTIEQRFHDAYMPEPNSGCWLWTKATTRGYGVLQIGTWARQQLRLAHRISFEIATGKSLSKKDVVCHSCDTPSCVNPQHLFVGTHADNIRDKMRKGRHTCGENTYNAALNEASVREIRRRVSDGESVIGIAKEHGVNRETIYKAVSKRTWRHVCP